MDTKALRQKILDLAIRGKLVPQNPEDEPASVLLERIRAEKEQMVKDGKLKAKDIKKDTVIFRGDDNLHYEKFADGTVKCIEDEIPFEVPEGWSWCRLNDISAAQLNSFVDGPFGSNLKTEHYTIAPEVRIIQLNNVGDLEWKNGIKKYTTYSHAENLERCKTVPGDIIIAKMMPAGRAVIVPPVHDIFVISSDNVRLRVANCINNYYIMYMINSTSINQQILSTVQGIGRSRTSLGKLKEIIIPLPPFDEQMRIVNKVKEVIELIYNISYESENLRDILHIMKSKILDLAIRGKLVPQDLNDEPASVLLKRIRAEKEELIKQGKLKRDKKESIIYRGDDNSYYLSGNKETLEMPFEIPDSWAWSTLYEICNYGETTNINADEIPDGAWILDLEDIEKDSGKILQKVTNKLRKATSTKHQFQPGMVLYSKLRPYLNKVIVANESGYCTSEILPLRFVKDVQPEYAQIFLMSPYFVEYANNCSYGMKMPRLGTKDGQKAFFPVPPHNEQIKIVEFVKDATAYIDSIYNLL